MNNWETLGHDNMKHLLSSTLKSGSFFLPYLFIGARGVGKFTLAKEFALKFLGSGGIPTDLIVFPAKENAEIEQLRAFLFRTNLTPVSADYTLAILDGIENLSLAAQNALLKILEEPPRLTRFILISHSLNLPATIISRCLVCPFSKLSLEILNQYVSRNNYKNVDVNTMLAAGGAIGRLVSILEDAKFAKAILQPAISLVDAVNISVQGKLMLVSELGALEVADLREILNTALSVSMNRLSAQPALYKFLYRLLNSIKMLESNVHKKLVLQNLLIT